MEIACTLLLCSVIILDSIGISLQSRGLPDEAYHSDSSSQHAEPTARERFPGVLGYRFEELEFIRLRPHCCPNRVFELRKYVFPPDKRIGLRARTGTLNPVPAGEQIVLSTSEGDVYAIMDRRSKTNICLRAICISVLGKPKRAKINIDTSAVKILTYDESAECPAYTHDRIAKNFAVFRAGTTIPHTGSSGPSLSPPSRHSSDTTQSLNTSHPSTGSPTPSEPSLRARSRSPTLRQTYSTVLGYRFEDLGTIRLTPHNYPHRTFELRIYAFPPEKPIGLRTKNNVLDPMPTTDQIVLSTSDGDVCAILHKKPNRTTMFRPMFMSNSGILERAKINMRSGEVTGLSPEENAECPLTYKEVISKVYRVFHV